MSRRVGWVVGLAPAAALAALGIWLGQDAPAFAQSYGDQVPESALRGPSHPVRRGDGVTEAYVRALQQQLKQHGYTPGPATGRLDPATAHAILEYQHDAGLRPGTEDAAILKETLDHVTFVKPPIYAHRGAPAGPPPAPYAAAPPPRSPLPPVALPPPAPSPSAAPPPAQIEPAGAPASAGDPRVAEAQRLLKRKGYDVDETGELDITTQNAIKAYEPGAGLPKDGQVSDALLQKLRQ